MNDICRNCISAMSLNKRFTDVSLEAQTDIKREKAKVKGKKAKLEAIEKAVTATSYREHIKLHGAFSLTKKPTDADGVYISCSNPETLKNEEANYDERVKTDTTLKKSGRVKREDKAEKDGTIHKYYFSCLHFKSK